MGSIGSTAVCDLREPAPQPPPSFERCRVPAPPARWSAPIVFETLNLTRKRAFFFVSVSRRRRVAHPLRRTGFTISVGETRNDVGRRRLGYCTCVVTRAPHASAICGRARVESKRIEDGLFDGGDGRRVDGGRGRVRYARLV